jgi:hypothetical protein
MDVPPIHTTRLELVSMAPEFMAAVLAGRLAEAQKLLGAELPAEPVDEAVERFLARRIGQLRKEPEVQRWLARAIVRKEGGRSMIGNIGFHGQPGVNAAGSDRASRSATGSSPSTGGRAMRPKRWKD